MSIRKNCFDFAFLKSAPGALKHFQFDKDGNDVQCSPETLSDSEAAIGEITTLRQLLSSVWTLENDLEVMIDLTLLRFSRLLQARRYDVFKRSLLVILHLQTDKMHLLRHIDELLLAGSDVIILSRSGGHSASLTELYSYAQIEVENPVALWFLSSPSSRIKTSLIDNLDTTSLEQLMSTFHLYWREKGMADNASFDSLASYNTTHSTENAPKNQQNSNYISMCSDIWTSLPNDTRQVALAEFVASAINQKLQKQSDLSSMHYFCAKVIPVKLLEVKVKRELTSSVLLYKLLLTVLTTSEERVMQLTTVQAQVRYEQHNMQLDNVAVVLEPGEGRTMHSVFDLCDAVAMTPKVRLMEFALVHFGTDAQIRHLHDSCLYFSIRDYGDSAVFSAMNNCDNKTYYVTFHLLSKHALLAKPKLTKERIGSHEEKLLNIAFLASYFLPNVDIRYKVSFTYSHNEGD